MHFRRKVYGRWLRYHEMYKKQTVEEPREVY